MGTLIETGLWIWGIVSLDKAILEVSVRNTGPRPIEGGQRDLYTQTRTVSPRLRIRGYTPSLVSIQRMPCFCWENGNKRWWILATEMGYGMVSNNNGSSSSKKRCYNLNQPT